MTPSSDYPSLDDDLRLALRLADAADAISRERFGALDLMIDTKPDSTPVTDADRAVEEAIRSLLSAERPDDSILGEEFGTSGVAARQWILDPIDGTAHFLRGVPIWATLIALAVDGVPVVGVVSAPALGTRWWAAAGSGAWAVETGRATAEAASARPPRRLRVSGIDTLAQATFSYNSIQQWDGAGRLPQLLDLARSVWRDRAYGDAWPYMLVAEGLLDGAGEFDVKPYDLAALVPIVQEAGGRFTSADGEDGPWHGSAIATNGALHDEVLALVARR
ncbi:inositol monophosphatase family protein [Rathayibacter iranicus]|uniref:Histidinol-phosphatase n=2 Tax=Rathayibacter iranicus TaxID=59737 RepID=A0AAD1AC14_9MICO|nr:inositol monophosphatase family protein [Rathayibacter iranicus]AZZ54640.1 histidinol phosphatase [Rathayibacter iranicus]MWV30427.1 histidinol phosphatase [Rathayibacter iranicus NCPPB 2253 = VKM Ac-1602]PPI51171.1 histidinol phosphatase [Rathayibacter iranicus]PPI63419.1 histidinol phosphatase [Rathayibacter iranicus]PPI74129.1 histidinol phosphatase [Rathayibacter iranicus]